MEPVCWGDVPVNAGLYYNNEKAIGGALSRLMKKGNTGSLLTFISDSPEIVDGVIMHIASIICQMREKSIDVFWFTAYPNSNFRDFGLALRKFLLNLWKKQDFKFIGESDFVVLSYEASSKNTPYDYYLYNIKALTAKVSLCDILIVLDLQQINNDSIRRDVEKLANLFLSSPSGGWHRGVVVSSSKNGEIVDVLRLSTPTPEISAFLERSRKPEMNFSTDRESSEMLLEAIPYVHPLVLLNQPAQRSVVDYILQSRPNVEVEIRKILEREALWRLGGDRVKLSPRSFAKHDEWARQAVLDGPFSDTVPNGAKLLSYQGVDRFVRQISGLDEIIKSTSESARIIDLCALSIGQKTASNGKFNDTIEFLMKELENGAKSLASTPTENARSLLIFASQMLLGNPDQFGISFFRLLERLSFGYAESISLQYGRNSHRIYEASRWLTNLGFIFDKIAPTINGRIYTARPDIYRHAANYLTHLEPDDLRVWAELRYTHAWQLWDCGDTKASIEMFLSAASKIRNHIFGDPLVDQIFHVFVQEFFVIALALVPERRIDEELKEILLEILKQYGSRLTADDVVESFKNKNTLIEEIGDQNEAIAPDVVVVGSYFDLHTALLIAHSLRKHYRRSPKIVLVPGSGDCALGAHLSECMTLMIGAPDTPGPIGKFVSERDPELVRIYQLRIFDVFGAAIDAPSDKHALHILSACGLAGNYHAWHAFLDRHASHLRLEKSSMDDLLRDFLVIPLVSAAEGRIFNDVVDRLVSMVHRRKNEVRETLNRARSKSSDELGAFVTSIDGDVKVALLDVLNGPGLAQALDDAMSNLRSRTLDLNQLLSIVSMAYELVDRLQRRAVPASYDEQRFNIFAGEFRNQRSEIEIQRQKYLAGAPPDYVQMNKAAEALSRALRNLKVATSPTASN